MPRAVRPCCGAMFHSSTQRRHWTFRSEEELARRRAEGNRRARARAAASGKVRGAVGVAGRSGAAGCKSRRTQAQLCFSQGAAVRPGAAGAARGAGTMQVLREEDARLLRRVQARDAAVRSGKRGEDGAAASAPLIPLLTACLDCS